MAAEELLGLAEELARAAGEIQRAGFRTFDPRDVSLKGRRNPVTEADLRSEQLIVEGILRRFPDHSVLGEEGGRRGGKGDYEWIVDPLDGTVNYTHGLPLFAAAIAVRHRQEFLASVIYNPILDEMYTAVAGGEATMNGVPIQVSAAPDLHEAMLATGFCYERNEVEDDNRGHFSDLIMLCRDIRRLGSAALDFAMVASGRIDAFWELHLSPWDLAAGTFLVERAGGRVTDLVGGSEVLARGDVVASNGTALHHELLGVLAKGETSEEDR